MGSNSSAIRHAPGPAVPQRKRRIFASGGGCHRTAIGSDGISRKCTCGQKMRLQQQQQQQQSSLYPDMMGGGGHIRSEDGLAGIATLRRPVKRKVRNQLPGSNNVQLQAGQGSSPAGSGAGPVNSGNLGISSGSSATAAGLLQQPKMETSVLLDKLLRAGALRPEDYLVLSRMERMIMANHAAGGNSSLNQSGTLQREPVRHGLAGLGGPAASVPATPVGRQQRTGRLGRTADTDATADPAVRHQPALARPFVTVRLLQQQFGQLLEQRGDGPGLIAGQQQRQRRTFLISATTATTTATATATAWALDKRVRRH